MTDETWRQNAWHTRHSWGITRIGTGTPGILTKVYPYPGYCITVWQNSQKFRVRVRKTHATHASSVYGMEVLQNSPKFWVGIQMLYPYLRYCGTGVQNLQKFRVRVWMLYKTHRSSGYGCECTEFTEVPVHGWYPGKHPGMVLYVPYLQSTTLQRVAAMIITETKMQLQQ